MPKCPNGHEVAAYQVEKCPVCAQLRTREIASREGERVFGGSLERMLAAQLNMAALGQIYVKKKKEEGGMGNESENENNGKTASRETV